jgi:DNA-binding beta-propeller fold protein YncE
MPLKLSGYVELPAHVKAGGFDHAAVHAGLNRLYVAHTANDAVDVIDCLEDRYLHSIPNLTGAAGALVSTESGLVFASNRGENTVGIFALDDERNSVSHLTQIAVTDPTPNPSPISRRGANRPSLVRALS